MKKILAMLLAAIMLLSLVACSTAGDNEEEKMKVGFIFLHDENSTYDKNFIDAANAAAAALGLSEDQIVMKVGIDESNACYEAACELWYR